METQLVWRLAVILVVVCGCREGDDDDPMPADPGVTCGEGTVEVEGACVAAPPDAGPRCGEGTVEQGGVCVPRIMARYELRTPLARVVADGHSRIPVLAIGTEADGAPSTVAVVLSTDRPAAGAFVEAQTTLVPLGRTVYFVPCNAVTDATCRGSFHLTLALASDPEHPVASVELELTAPEGVGSPAPCLIGGNAMFFDGNDYIYDGTLLVTAGEWSADGGSRDLMFDITPPEREQGLWWSLEFSSRELGTALVPGVYEKAQRAAFASPGHPGMDVGGDGRRCNAITGRFQIHDLALVDGEVDHATVTFEQHCEGGAKVLEGCVHYER